MDFFGKKTVYVQPDRTSGEMQKIVYIPLEDCTAKRQRELMIEQIKHPNRFTRV